MYHKWLSSDVWFLRYGAWQTYFVVILNHFLPLYLASNLKVNLKFEKLKKQTTTTKKNNNNKRNPWKYYHFTHVYHKWQSYTPQFLRYWALRTNFLSWRSKNFQKWKYFLEIWSFYTCAPKITIIWCMVPEIRSETDSNFCHFWLFFALLLPSPINDPKNQNFEKKKEKKKVSGDIILLCIHVYIEWRSYDIWFLKYKVRQIEIVVILGHFLPFQSPDNPENQNFKIEKESPGDITILHIFTINYNHMIYGSWDMEHNPQNSLSFWTVICLFTPYGSRESKFRKDEKHTGRYYHLTNVYHK